MKKGYKLQSLLLLLVLFTSIGFDVAYMYSQAIVDPYVYIPRLTMPKLIITSSNDEFFPIDDRYLQNPLFSSSGSFFIFPYYSIQLAQYAGKFLGISFSPAFIMHCPILIEQLLILCVFDSVECPSKSFACESTTSGLTGQPQHSLFCQSVPSNL